MRKKKKRTVKTKTAIVRNLSERDYRLVKKREGNVSEWMRQQFEKYRKEVKHGVVRNTQGN